MFLRKRVTNGGCTYHKHYRKKGPGRRHALLNNFAIEEAEGRWVRGVPGAKIAKKIVEKRLGVVKRATLG